MSTVARNKTRGRTTPCSELARAPANHHGVSVMRITGDGEVQVINASKPNRVGAVTVQSAGQQEAIASPGVVK